MESTDEDGNLHFTRLEVHHSQLVPIDDNHADNNVDGLNILNSNKQEEYPWIRIKK